MNEDSIRIFAAAAFIALIPIIGMLYLQVSKMKARRRTKKIADGGADFVAHEWVGRPQFAEAPMASSFVENYIDPQAQIAATQTGAAGPVPGGEGSVPQGGGDESASDSSDPEVASVFGGGLQSNSLSAFPAAPNAGKEGGR